MARKKITRHKLHPKFVDAVYAHRAATGTTLGSLALLVGFPVASVLRLSAILRGTWAIGEPDVERLQKLAALINYTGPVFL